MNIAWFIIGCIFNGRINKLMKSEEMSMNVIKNVIIISLIIFTAREVYKHLMKQTKKVMLIVFLRKEDNVFINIHEGRRQRL